MKKFSEYAVIYDISQDRERRRVEKILKGFGFRIQKSVFECALNRGGREELIRQLEALEVKSGFIKIYRLEYSWKDCTIGEKKRGTLDDDIAFIV